MEYDKYFRKLFENCINGDFYNYGINVYYETWRHRSINPEWYQNGEYICPNLLAGMEDILQNEENWFNKEVVKLLYYYHYSADVRNKGECPEKIKVSDVYIKGVEKVQKMMQRFVGNRGICIEANPTSNYLISTIESYQEHPISNLYNLGLTWNEKDMNKCAQINVSINTDDNLLFNLAYPQLITPDNEILYITNTSFLKQIYSHSSQVYTMADENEVIIKYSINH